MNRLLEKYPWLKSVRTLAIIYLTVVIIATVQRLLLGPQEYNNFSIFRWSFFNLLHENDLYAPHPDQYDDLYKYSPTFALFMAPFFALPAWAGLFLWNLLNAGLPFWAVIRLNISSKAKAFLLFYILIELCTALQNSQSNGIMAGLMIGVFTAFERKQMTLAALLLCLGFYVKLFPAVVGILFLFYEKKPRFLISVLVGGILLGVLPLLVTGVDELIFQYQSWLHLLRSDTPTRGIISLMTLTQRWFHVNWPGSWLLIPGGIMLLLPLTRISLWEFFSWRLLFLSSILVWVVIFNPQAESPTFIIAVCGIALWALTERPGAGRTLLLWFVFLFTILSPTDLFPHYLKQNLWKPYCLKVLPCIVGWGVMTGRLLAPQREALSVLPLPACPAGEAV